jgi:hypothetical protein
MDEHKERKKVRRRSCFCQGVSKNHKKFPCLKEKMMQSGRKKN